MNGQLLVEFEFPDLTALLTSYTDGAVPLDARITDLLQHDKLQRMIILLVESSQWEGPKIPGTDQYAPLQVRYEGQRCLVIERSDLPMEWCSVEPPQAK